MDDEWDVEAICVIEEDELALVTMMREHIDYEDDWIIDSRCSNHMTDDRVTQGKQGDPQTKKYYQT